MRSQGRARQCTFSHTGGVRLTIATLHRVVKGDLTIQFVPHARGIMLVANE
jgi:hypothetical protein